MSKQVIGLASGGEQRAADILKPFASFLRKNMDGVREFYAVSMGNRCRRPVQVPC